MALRSLMRSLLLALKTSRVRVLVPQLLLRCTTAIIMVVAIGIVQHYPLRVRLRDMRLRCTTQKMTTMRIMKMTWSSRRHHLHPRHKRIVIRNVKKL